MKKIILLIFLFIGAKNFAQTNGITYQAVILNPQGQQLPGVNNPNAFLVSKDICMLFKFVDEYSNVEYQEVIQTKTDEFGMVNLIIGSGSQTAGYASSFDEIVWNAVSKKMIVAVNTNGSCSSFTEISNQPFNSVPTAFFAKNAENVTGVVPIENGGTNAVTVLGAKTNLGLEQVNNTTDLDKPVSSAAQFEFNLKENSSNKSISIPSDQASDVKYPTVKSVKTYIDAATTSAASLLAAEITRATTAETVLTNTFKVEAGTARAAESANATAITAEATRAGIAEVANADGITAEAIARAAADEILTTGLDLKAPLASPTFTGTPVAPTAAAGTNTTQIATAEFVGIAITDKFVDLTTDQTIAGIKTFSVDADVNGLTVGRGKFNENSNTAIGNAALATNAGYANTALGRAALELNTSGNGNTANGNTALAVNTEGNENTGIGQSALFNNTIGNNNTALGYNSGIGNTTGSGNTFLGTYATVSNGAFSNATAIGYQANATAINTIQLGNTDVTDVRTSGTITAGEVKYPNTKGTKGQVLTSTGNGTATWATPSSANNGSSLQLVSTSERDDLGLATSGHLVLNTTTNTFQGSKAILPPYDYYTTTNYGFSMIIPGYSLTQTFTAGGQTISSAKIATVNMGSGWASNSGSFTFAIHDDVNNYNLFSTTITISGAGDIIVPISGYDWSSGYPPVSGPLKLPVGTCSFVITSSSSGGGSANFLLNAARGVGVLTNTYWESRGGTSAGYTNPNTNNPLSIALYPSAQSGIIWVDLSK